ncbi:MAG: hypothetical protein PHI84_01625 [Kiritimatiellae bacterium]|nr:hypothetical protein [Kiritimatiellia bacterium]
MNHILKVYGLDVLEIYKNYTGLVSKTSRIKKQNLVLNRISPNAIQELKKLSRTAGIMEKEIEAVIKSGSRSMTENQKRYVNGLRNLARILHRLIASYSLLVKLYCSRGEDVNSISFVKLEKAQKKHYRLWEKYEEVEEEFWKWHKRMEG